MQMSTKCELESSPNTLILLSIRCLVNMLIHPQPNYVMKNKWEFILYIHIYSELYHIY